jgi:hypothetical protein
MGAWTAIQADQANTTALAARPLLLLGLANPANSGSPLTNCAT